MREPSSNQSEREQRCCISSDAEGRIWTSFPPLSHPLSIRPVPESFYHFDRFDSENTGTAIAQVGRAISPVPSSQKAENLEWHEWVGQPSSPVSSHVAIEGSRTSIEHRVSPGVSEVPRPKRKPQDSPPSLPPLNGFTADRSTDTVESRGEEIQPVSTSGPSRENNMVAGINIRGQGRVVTCVGHVLNPACVSDDNSSSQSPPTAPQACISAGEINSDEAWKTFVFGDENSDEIGKAAFEEAKHDAVRSLQPSNTLVSPSNNFKSDEDSNIATIGTLPFYTQDRQTSGSDSREAYSSAGAPSSQEVTYGPSLAETELEGPRNNSDVSFQPPSVVVNAGTSSPSQIDITINTSESDEFGSPEQADISASESHAAAPSMATSVAVAPAHSKVSPSETSDTAEQFRFSQPKLFIGSRLNLPQPGRIVEYGVGSINVTKRRRGRPKKRANDGRADIRALPNYSSDPIEEFEEERRVRKEGRAPESLFPALELT
ncbi:uncharacterized protein B0H64DRAFT_320805 [Chaetomium fimeti]|uniref:Uncharacterized protein n=1 Tax=Chaetomium fimeti TaxID=1854472 RepID=A0AAE0LT71_9PEZI|nr:hypothetical protein B0H64DRAFT_320805 [Chaetomium fimeti]